MVIDAQSIGTPFVPAHRFKSNFLDYYAEFVVGNKRRTIGSGLSTYILVNNATLVSIVTAEQWFKPDNSRIDPGCILDLEKDSVEAKYLAKNKVLIQTLPMSLIRDSVLGQPTALLGYPENIDGVLMFLDIQYVRSIYLLQERQSSSARMKSDPF